MDQLRTQKYQSQILQKGGFLLNFQEQMPYGADTKKKKKTDRTKHMKHPQTIINLSEVGNLSELQ